MTGFVVELDDRPGALTRVLDAIAEADVNVLAYGAAAGPGRALAVLLGNDDGAIRAALRALGTPFAETALVFVRVRDEPGQLAEVTRRLGESGVNLSLCAVVERAGHQVVFALGVHDPLGARELLGHRVTAWDYRPSTG